jgi:hypothetical protein
MHLDLHKLSFFFVLFCLFKRRRLLEWIESVFWRFPEIQVWLCEIWALFEFRSRHFIITHSSES